MTMCWMSQLQQDYEKVCETTGVVGSEARNLDMERPLTCTLPGNARQIMEAEAVQNNADLRKIVLCRRRSVCLTLADLREALLLVREISGGSNLLVEVLDSEGHEIECEMIVSIVKMLVIADAHLHLSFSPSVVSL